MSSGVPSISTSLTSVLLARSHTEKLRPLGFGGTSSCWPSVAPAISSRASWSTNCRRSTWLFHVGKDATVRLLAASTTASGVATSLPSEEIATVATKG